MIKEICENSKENVEKDERNCTKKLERAREEEVEGEVDLVASASATIGVLARRKSFQQPGI